jgi:cardiolipin synthase
VAPHGVDGALTVRNGWASRERRGVEIAQPAAVARPIRHRKLILSIVIILLAVGGMLALAQDQVTLKIQSAHAADDPQFPGYVAVLLGAEATGGNQYTVLTNGDQIFPAMLAAVNGARRRISFETYIYNKGSVGDQFTQAF